MKKIYSISILPYTIFLLYLMFFGFNRGVQNNTAAQFIPFKTIFHFFTDSGDYKNFIINILGNIILFIPFGMANLILKKKQKYAILLFIFVVIMFCVEALQNITGRGMFDVDDVLLNSIGMSLGFYFFKKMKWN